MHMDKPLNHFSYQHPKIPFSVMTTPVKDKGLVCFQFQLCTSLGHNTCKDGGWWGDFPGFLQSQSLSAQRIVEGLQMGKIPSIHCEWSFFGVLDKSVQEASSMNPELRND